VAGIASRAGRGRGLSDGTAAMPANLAVTPALPLAGDQHSSGRKEVTGIVREELIVE
jgi:hypothetical protein